ncbi:MAG TPA: NADH-ubiquinone oxidoreductase-F iron-sulfur binding region domain-containing protein [Candidatus Sulfotelmatobacter sp.]|nr:NADH-ubiquinone oxidoreductase-F iron-sulfur binding region domain-containing protein [Candidatus Sulfotelmatobacter sp.]
MSHTPGEVRHFDHPGAGRKRAKATPKGRTVDPRALDEVRALLGDRPRRRDLLIEHLHLIQDRYHQLSAAHLAALADEMRLAFAEVYETATFYAHFDIVKEDEAALAPLVVRVCDSLTCALFGADKLQAELERLEGKSVRVVRAPCVGLCDQAPAVEVGHNFIGHADAQKVADAIQRGDTHAHAPTTIDAKAYRAAGGYQLLERVRSGALAVDDIIATVEKAGLRGLGGAGFPTARKWRSVRGEPGPRLMAVNADEGEPGTFKDRYYLGSDPHRFLEGMLIAASVVEATDVYIYLRDEYPAIRDVLAREIQNVPAGGPTIHLRRGAGAYICGEESSMLESIEGKRGLPRNRPPFPFQVGLFGRPTLINNVETLYWVRHILETGTPPLRSYSVSGHVKQPRVVVVPPGITVRALIEQCGGMQDGHVFKAYLPGGASGGILPASLGDLPLDFGQLEKHGCFVGSHAVVILSDKDDMKAVALNLMRFFEDESCGQCTPCRAGTEKAVKLMDRPRWDAALLEELSTVMRDASICGLGQAAANPMLSVLKHFRDEVMS